ncbi:MAG: DUF255 domain-containing protein [Phycisphaerales bacterium JB040]
MPNALAAETSPYLLQHAHNPVEWRAWNPDTLAEARARNLPIFLSIGYSTCYWCHVMERESFEHEPTAQLLNERFTPVKLDREERPDLDDLYMAATVTFTGRGGWPMSVFLEPDTLRPFFCGTYFPLDPRHGLPSFRQVLGGMHNAWNTQRDEVREQGEKLAAAVADQIARAGDPAPLGRVQLDQALRVLLNQFDPSHAGFGGAGQGPKFPQPVFCEFLLDVRDDADDTTRTAIDAALRTTLDAMSYGGIHDHLAGGFHRYAVDATWTVPHFEKMLYDNAQLLDLYARAATVFDSPWYARTARRTADYLLREMSAGMEGESRGGGGGFFSAQDAEVDSREGLSFLWNEEQVRAALDEDDADFAVASFAIDRGTNFQDPHHPDDPPANVLRLPAPPESLARTLGMPTQDFTERLTRVSEALRSARDRRPQPGTDDKILTGWNGLAIGALARASGLLHESRYADAARAAARFLLARHRSERGTLLRTSRAGGPAHTPAFLEDHAALAGACLALHALDPSETEFLDAARNLLDDAFELFADKAGAGVVLYDARTDQGDLFVRPRSTHDGAVPSAQSQTLHALLDLAETSGDPTDIERCAAHLNALSPAIAANPYSTLHAVRAFRRILKNRAAYEPHVAFFDEEAPRAQPSAPPAVPVEVYASAERVAVADDEPAEFQLVLRIKPGHHVVAADPGPDAPRGLLPMRVGLVSGQGVGVYADYPAGTPHGVESVGRVNVYESDEQGLEFTVALEKADGVGASPGHPILGITLQACTDTECLPPITLELDVAVDIN